MNQKFKTEFTVGKKMDNMDFAIQFNCSSACWRSMIPDPDDVVLAVRLFNENMFIQEVNLPYNFPPIIRSFYDLF